jgi:hypothetical protein
MLSATEYYYIHEVSPQGQVIIKLGGPKTLTPINLFRKADAALQQGLSEPEIEGGASIATALMALAMRSYLQDGWCADLATIRAAVLRMRKSADKCATIAQGVSVNVLADLIEGIDEILLQLGVADAR